MRDSGLARFPVADPYWLYILTFGGGNNIVRFGTRPWLPLRRVNGEASKLCRVGFLTSVNREKPSIVQHLPQFTPASHVTTLVGSEMTKYSINSWTIADIEVANKKDLWVP